MPKWTCTQCDGEESPCFCEICDYHTTPTHCMIDGNDDAVWKEVKEEPTTNSSQLQKFTAEVFDRDDCPAWAQWAALDEIGFAYYFEYKPECGFTRWMNECGAIRIIDGKFDTSDWKNSLVKRYAKALPEWCKVGAWVWVKSAKSYEKIAEIYDSKIAIKHFFLNVEAIGKTVFQARVRPWTFEEAPFWVKAKDKNGKFELLRLHVEDSGNFFFRYHGYTDERADFFAENFTQLDGSPCGVLEHLEGGEWVR